MNLRFAVAILAVCLGIFPLAKAATLNGTVINGTTVNAASGAEVVLLSLADGMSEIARTTTDAAGRFRFGVPDAQPPSLVRVLHQGVTYHKLVQPGINHVQVQVYNATPKLNAVRVVMDAQRYEAAGDTLRVSELITLRNSSSPPRTLVHQRGFEIRLPPEAQLEAGLIQVARGQRLKLMPTTGERAGQYYFPVPVRPGETRLAVVYRLPYAGAATIEPQVVHPLDGFAVILPKTMSFEANTGGVFKPLATKAEANVVVATAIKPGQKFSFKVSGTGGITQPAEEQASDPQPPRPGGGLGVPTNAPDPLFEYRGAILTALALMLFSGAMFITLRRKPQLHPVSRPAALSRRAWADHKTAAAKAMAGARRS